MKFMTPWELRGYLTYPRNDGKPLAGTPEEINFAKGWERAQREDILSRQSYLAQEIDFDSEFGRDTFASSYVSKEDENNFKF